MRRVVWLVPILLALAACYYGRPDGKLSRVGFHFDCWGIKRKNDSEWQGKWLWTSDEAFLRRVDAWRRSIEPWPADKCQHALAQRGGKIVLEFASGRQEIYLFR